MRLFDGLKTRIKNLLSTDEDVKVTPIEKPVDTYSFLDVNSTDIDRNTNLDLYDTMEADLPEFSDALDTLADLTIQGDDVLMRGHKVIVEQLSMSDAANYDVVLSDAVSSNVELNRKVDEIIKKFEKRTKIKYLLRNMTREAIKYGDFFAEVIYGENASGEKYITELIPLPIRSMRLNHDKYGRLDKKKPYGISPDGSDIVLYDKIKVFRIQFGANFENKFGISLAYSGRKTYARLNAMESGMVVKRMVRATMRYLFKIDTTGLSFKQAFDRVQKIKKLFTRKKITDKYGNLVNINAPLTTEEDIYIPTKKGTDDDVKVLEGSNDNSEIGDIRYFQDKLHRCFKVAQAVGSQIKGSRNAIAELDTNTIRFIKTHIQNQVRLALEWLYTQELKLHGISGDNILHIEMPEIASVNEIRKWDIERLRAEITKVHVDANVVSDEWIMENILYMTEDEKEIEIQRKKEREKEMEKALNKNTPTNTVRVKTNYKNKDLKTKSNSYTTPKASE